MENVAVRREMFLCLGKSYVEELTTVEFLLHALFNNYYPVAYLLQLKKMVEIMEEDS